MAAIRSSAAGPTSSRGGRARGRFDASALHRRSGKRGSPSLPRITHPIGGNRLLWPWAVSTGTAIAIAAALRCPRRVAQVQRTARTTLAARRVSCPGRAGPRARSSSGRPAHRGAAAAQDDQIQPTGTRASRRPASASGPVTLAHVSPRSDVVVMRDRPRRPHVYGANRAARCSRSGTSPPRTNVLHRHPPQRRPRDARELPGGSQGSAARPRPVARAPYTEADLQRQIEEGAAAAPTGAARCCATTSATRRRDQPVHPRGAPEPLKIPASIRRSAPAGPADWRETYTVAVSALVGGLLATAAEPSSQRRRAARVRRRFRRATTPIAASPGSAPPTTRRRRAAPERSPLPLPGRAAARAAPRCRTPLAARRAASDPASAAARPEPRPGRAGRLGGLRAAFPSSSSNALVVSAASRRAGARWRSSGPRSPTSRLRC